MPVVGTVSGVIYPCNVGWCTLVHPNTLYNTPTTTPPLYHPSSPHTQTQIHNLLRVNLEMPSGQFGPHRLAFQSRAYYVRTSFTVCFFAVTGMLFEDLF